MLITVTVPPVAQGPPLWIKRSRHQGFRMKVTPEDELFVIRVELIFAVVSGTLEIQTRIFRMTSVVGGRTNRTSG